MAYHGHAVPAGRERGAVKPFLRWVGGKTRLLPKLRQIIGKETIRNYFEPCLGGGAVFFDLWDQQNAEGGPLIQGSKFLNDVNIPLIQAYIAIRDNPLLVQKTLQQLQGVPYDSIRDEFNSGPLGLVRRAALLLALNHLCFNGLWRVNKKHGHFNVPVGRNAKGVERSLEVFEWNSLKAASVALAGVTFSALSLFPWPWTEVLPGEGDLVFYDPPYLDVYADYHLSRFADIKHKELAAQARAQAQMGARVIVCGSTTPDSIKIYGEPTYVIELERTVGASLRGKATEAIFVYGKR